MKKILTIFLALGLLFAFGCKEDSDSWSRIKKEGVFVVGLDDNFPPMGFRGENGEIVGFDIDLANAAAAKLGLKAEFKPVDWDGIVMSLNKGDIDVIWNGLTITDERKEKIAFSPAYMANRQIVVVQKDSEVQTLSDLQGKVVGLQMGSSSQKALDGNQAVSSSLKNVRKYSNNTEALLDLEAGRIDAVVVDEIVGRYYIAKKPGIYTVLEENLGHEEYGVGMRKSDAEFVKKLSAAIDELKNDGTADGISKKWFGESVLLK